MSEIFEDKTENGKVRPWRERKIENVRYAEYLAILEFKRAHDVRVVVKFCVFVRLAST